MMSIRTHVDRITKKDNVYNTKLKRLYSIKNAKFNSVRFFEYSHAKTKHGKRVKKLYILNLYHILIYSIRKK